MLRLINNLRGTLVSAISATDSLLEFDAEIAPRVAQLLDSDRNLLALTLFSATQLEVVYVQMSDPTPHRFYVWRGREGTTAAAWPAGSVFEARLTAAVAEALPRQALAMALTGNGDVLVGADGNVLWGDAPQSTFF